MWNAREYDSRHHYVTDYGSSLVAVLDPRPGERILDAGCGTGHLTKQIADSGAAVLGIDSSQDMIAQARESYPELRFSVADAASFRACEPFDAVFSNAALHWMKPPEAVADSLAAALKPRGRLVLEMGGKGNIRSITGLVGMGPWYFPGIGEYASLLEAHGLEVETAALFPRPTAVEGESGLRDWLKMFAPFIPSERIAELETALRPKLYRDGSWFIDYVRLRMTAHKHEPVR